MHFIGGKRLSLKELEMEVSKSVENYRQEMELYTLKLSLEEDKDASIARFLSGLKRDIANQLELYSYTTYEDMCHLETKIETQKKRSGFSKTTLPSSRNMVSKAQASTFKCLPKKQEAPNVAFKDNSKPKVEEKDRLITNPIRCIKCNGLGHIANNYPTKRTLIFREDWHG
ncbi:hypothetical protein M9H77_34879 [Catharanthus roseus]|uniref:Uncharacterized protein n=1 Tax=Catharanthus roseus TaxID=4058 RepID=A0ACB9ZMF0_CATRO|nr:hypothetical protein M9H77_34879 [Catharanthus roseus]